MNRQAEWYQRLLLSLTAEDFRLALEELVANWNFEGALALERFWPHALPEQQTKIVTEFRRVPPAQGKMAIRLLCLWGYDAPRRLKSEILKTLAHFRSPSCIWRLWALYTHTVHGEKKISVLHIFGLLQSGLFFTDAMERFESESEEVQEALLDWAETIPFLGDEDRLLLEQALHSRLETRDPDNLGAFWHRRSQGMLRHGLSLRRIFRNHLTGPVLDSVSTPSPEILPELAWALMLQPSKPKLRIDPDVFWAQALTGDKTLSFGALDTPIRDSAAVHLARKLPEWAHAASLVPLHLALDRLRVFDLAASGPLVDALKGEGSAPYKQAILEHLLTWRLSPAMKEELQMVVHLLLSDTRHVRIFEVLARVQILIFGEAGLRHLMDAFERHEDREHTLALLKGLLHALREDGAMKHLHTAGLLQVHQIAARISDILRRPATKPDMLFDRFCRLVALLRISEKQADLLELLPRESITPATVSALVLLDTPATIRAAGEILVRAMENHRDRGELLSQAWADLSTTDLREVASLGDGLFRSALEIPEQAPLALHVLAVHPLGFCRSRIAGWASQGPVLTRARALDALTHLPAESFLAEILAVLQPEPEPLIYDRAIHAILPLCDGETLKAWISHYVEVRGEPQSLKKLFQNLSDRPALLELGLKELLTYRQHPRFHRFAPLLGYFLKAWDDLDNPLPLDSILGSDRSSRPPLKPGPPPAA